MVDAYAERWALITGASSGIGAEFARKLAGRGMHLVLAARRRELMEELSEELHTRHGTRTEIFERDLSDPDQVRGLVEEVRSRGIEVELLVNNAGVGIVDVVDQTDPERVQHMLRLNVLAMAELTYRFLPEMLGRGHGAIVNVSSAAAFQPVAYMGAYAASKAFILHFSEALWAECRDRGVTVTALCPGVTRTSFLDRAGVSGWLKKYHSLPPEQVVKAALKALEKRRPSVIPGWRNYFRSLLVRIATRRTAVVESMKYFRPTTKKEKVKS